MNNLEHLVLLDCVRELTAIEVFDNVLAERDGRPHPPRRSALVAAEALLSAPREESEEELEGEECSECFEIIPHGPGDSLMNRHHAFHCSLYDVFQQ